jgi:hypothetical protein
MTGKGMLTDIYKKTVISMTWVFNRIESRSGKSKTNLFVGIKKPGEYRSSGVLREFVQGSCRRGRNRAKRVSIYPKAILVIGSEV